ncbi:MAG: hypothetical protein ABWK01_06875 [Infirmifilum sp.]
MNIRILVTGSGGIGGVNFVRALRLAEKMGKLKYFIAGTDYNQYHILFPQVDARVRPQARRCQLHPSFAGNPQEGLHTVTAPSPEL